MTFLFFVCLSVCLSNDAGMKVQVISEFWDKVEQFFFSCMSFFIVLVLKCVWLSLFACVQAALECLCIYTFLMVVHVHLGRKIHENVFSRMLSIFTQ